MEEVEEVVEAEAGGWRWEAAACPFMISRSVLQTPAMSTRTTASPSLGVGTGMDCSEAESPATTKPCCEQSIGRLAAVGRSVGEEDALCWWAVEKEQHRIAGEIR